MATAKRHKAVTGNEVIANNNAVFQEAENFLRDRVSLPDERFLLPMVLWAAHTYCWQDCQFVLPYLGFIGVSGSGKNRGMCAVGSLSNNYYMPSIVTPAALRDEIHQKEPTLGVEECEKELNQHGSPLHRIYNSGYMPGSHWDKKIGLYTIPLSIYCPKMFSAIADPESSLRRRCIMVPMSVGTPAIDDEPQVFEPIGHHIGRRIQAAVITRVEDIAEIYRSPSYFTVPASITAENFQVLKSLWSICAVVLPERLAEAQRISTYIMSMKARPLHTVPQMRLRKEQDELKERCHWLLMDTAEAVKDWTNKNIRTSVLIPMVLKLRDGWWEGYQYEDTKGNGIGIGDKNGAGVFAKMLSLASDDKVKPGLRNMGKPDGKTAHGYCVADILEAAYGSATVTDFTPNPGEQDENKERAVLLLPASSVADAPSPEPAPPADTRNSTDNKRYWITPPALLEQIKAEFCPNGEELFDPCPHPRGHLDGLNCEWGLVNYVNCPWKSGDTWTPDGKKKGITAWARKAIEEQSKGKTVIMIGPLGWGWTEIMTAAKAEVRVMGEEIKFLSIEDGTPSTRTRQPIVMYILRGATGAHNKAEITDIKLVDPKRPDAITPATKPATDSQGGDPAPKSTPAPAPEPAEEPTQESCGPRKALPGETCTCISEPNLKPDEVCGAAAVVTCDCGSWCTNGLCISVCVEALGLYLGLDEDALPEPEAAADDSGGDPAPESQPAAPAGEPEPTDDTPDWEKPEYDYLKRIKGAELRHANSIIAALRNEPSTRYELITENNARERPIPKFSNRLSKLELAGIVQCNGDVRELAPGFLQHELATLGPVNVNSTSLLPVLNNSNDDDQERDEESPVAIKGCSYIYAPKGQAGEYSPLAANPYRGCGHGCKYCYVPAVLHMKRPEFDAGAVPRPEFLRHLRKDAAKYLAARCTEQVMLSFTTDPYHLGDSTLTRQTIECLQEHGMAVCTLTKGGTRALRDLDMFRPSRDAFASTLTSLDDAFSRKWESNAALPGDRIQALEAFHERGIYTWVSLEPTLDCDSSLEIIRQTHRFIDLYKVGRANYLPMTKATDWKSYTERIVELCAQLNVRHYIKKDLQQYLPAGYKNVLRQVQHH